MSKIFWLALIALACLAFTRFWWLPSLRRNGPPSDPVNFISTAAEVHAVGSVFAYPLRLDDTRGAVNTIQADLGFDPLLLQVVDIGTTDSLATIFLQKIIDNQTGFVRLTGALPNPGHAGGGVLGTIYFRALAPGDAVVHYLESCLILANDGRGTNLISHFPHTYYHLTLDHADPPPLESTPMYLVPVESETTDTPPLYLYQYSDKLPSPPPKTHSPQHQ